MKAILVNPGYFLDYTVDIPVLPRVGDSIVYRYWVITRITHVPCHRMIAELADYGFISNHHLGKEFDLIIWVIVEAVK